MTDEEKVINGLTYVRRAIRPRRVPAPGGKTVEVWEWPAGWLPEPHVDPDTAKEWPGWERKAA